MSLNPQMRATIFRRVLKYYGIVKDVASIPAIDLLNNDPLNAVNAAGTAQVALLKLDSSNVTQLSNGANIPTGKTFGATDAGGIAATRPKITTAIDDANGKNEIGFTATTSAVNNVNVANAIATAAPVLSVVGTDAAIGLKISPKSTGVINVTGPAVFNSSVNYIATESGANNAIAGALVDASGAAVALATGLVVTVKLAHTLQAGGNTFNFNGGGALNIKSHYNTATDIGTAYASTGIVRLIYNGTIWLDMAQ